MWVRRGRQVLLSFLFSSIRKTRVWSSQARVKSRLALQFYMTFIFQRRKMVKKTNQTKTKTENYSLRFFSLCRMQWKWKDASRPKSLSFCELSGQVSVLCVFCCVCPPHTQRHTQRHTHTYTQTVQRWWIASPIDTQYFYLELKVKSFKNSSQRFDVLFSMPPFHCVLADGKMVVPAFCYIRAPLHSTITDCKPRPNTHCKTIFVGGWLHKVYTNSPLLTVRQMLSRILDVWNTMSKFWLKWKDVTNDSSVKYVTPWC